jgi:hypothetical protein
LATAIGDRFRRARLRGALPASSTRIVVVGAVHDVLEILLDARHRLL